MKSTSLIAAMTALLTGTLLAGCTTVPAREAVTVDLVIDHLTVVDVRTGALLHDRAVVIADGRIKAVVRAGSLSVGGTARLVDGHGSFVVPGYNDMHAHNLNTASPETSLPLMLANGITGFRQMAGAPQLLAARAAGRPLLPTDSPALLAMPGTILAGPAYATPEAAKREIDSQKAQGADFIKAVDMPPAAFLAAADEAEADGLPFSGHLAPTVDPRDAIRHGMDSIEHLGPTISLLLACSTDEVPMRARMLAAPAGPGLDFNIEPGKLMRLLANPVLLSPPQAFPGIRRVLDTYDAARCQALAGDLAASQTWIVPTLTRLEAMNLGNDPALRGNPDLRYVPAASRQMWLEVGDDFDARLTPEQRKIMADLFASQLALAKLFDDGGVKMMTGTDFGGQWIVPGQSLHHEFDLLSRAGISPLHILQMTTINPARYLHREADMGTVEAGRQADLVLLSADPTRAVANLHKITAVVRGGRYLDRADLDAIARNAEQALQ